MNFPIPKRDKKDKKSSKDVTPTSTGLKDPNKKRKSIDKSKGASEQNSPSKHVTTTKVEIGLNEDEESDRDENTADHLLDIQPAKENDEETVISTYSEVSESSKESISKRPKSPRRSPTIKKTIVQATMVPEVYLKDLEYTHIKSLQTYVELKKSLGQPFDLSKLIRPDVKQTITEFFVEFEVANATEWLTWSHEMLFEQLINLSGGESNVTSIQEKLDNAKAKVLKAAKDLVYHP